MRFLYVADLHGEKRAYEATFRAAADLEARAIVNGGDLLPHGLGEILPAQRGFLGWLGGHLEAVRASGLRTYLMFGNDDARSLAGILDEWGRDGLAVRLDAGWSDLGGWEVLGFPWIPDPPFRLKDWSRHDDGRRHTGIQFGSPVVSTPDGVIRAGIDAKTYLSALPTIEDELAMLPPPRDPERAVFVMHGPPAGTDLDVCYDGRSVGSLAARRFIEASGFPLALHGHIHEAPRVSGRWHARLGRTTCVNPGSEDRPQWVLVDLDARALRHRFLGEIRF